MSNAPAGRRAASAILACLAVSCLGCLCPRLSLLCPMSPELSVSSHNVCKDGTVDLSWRAEGCAELLPSTPNSCTGHVASSATRKCQVSADTVFRLNVYRAGGTAFSTQEVDVLPAEGKDIRPIAAATE